MEYTLNEFNYFERVRAIEEMEHNIIFPEFNWTQVVDAIRSVEFPTVTKENLFMFVSILCIAVATSGFVATSGCRLVKPRYPEIFRSIITVFSVIIAQACYWTSAWWFVGGVAFVAVFGLLLSVFGFDEGLKDIFDSEENRRLLQFLPYERVERYLSSNRKIQETMISYNVVDCTARIGKKRIEVPCPTEGHIEEWCKKFNITTIEKLEEVLKSVRFYVDMDFNPTIRKKSGLIPSHATAAFHEPLIAVHKLFETHEASEYCHTFVSPKYRKFTRNGEETKVMTNDLSFRTARYTEYKNIGDLMPQVTAERSTRIANGNNSYVNAVTKGQLFFGGAKEKFNVLPCGYRTALYDPEIVSACLHNTDCKLVETLRSYAKRRLDGNALSGNNTDRIVDGIVEVAQIADAYEMLRVLSGQKGELSRTYCRVALRKKGLLKYESKIKKEGETRENQKLVESAYKIDEQYESSSAFRRKFLVAMIGLSLAVGSVAELAAKAPARPAKRPAKLIIPRVEPARNASKKVALNPDLPLAFPFYNRKDVGVAEASYLGRINKDNGAADYEGAEALYAATKRAIAELQPPNFAEMTLEKNDLYKWVMSRKSWNQAKRDRHLAVLAEMPMEITPDYVREVSEMEAFIKDEPYAVSAIPCMRTTADKVKAPRNICDRKMEFKMVAGAMIQQINDWFFEHDFCIKHIPQQLRGKFIDDRFAGRGYCLTTDHSAFESSANAVNQQLCEGLFYRMMLPKQYWWIHDIICQPNWIRNKNTKAKILTDVVRYSGDLTTSVGNSMLNYCSATAAYARLTGRPLPEVDAKEREFILDVMGSYGYASGRPLTALGDPLFTDMKNNDHVIQRIRDTRLDSSMSLPLTVLVEGDDAIVAAPDLPAADKYQAKMRTMGLNVTIEGSSDASKAGFCSTFWHQTPKGIVTYVDPINNIINASWSTTLPTRKFSADDLYKAKLRSIIDFCPGCPVIWKYLRGFNTACLVDNGWNKEWLEKEGKAYRAYNGWLLYEVGEAQEPSDEDRLMFTELHGLSIAAQRELEIDPEKGLVELVRFCMNSGRATDLEDYVSEYGIYNYISLGDDKQSANGAKHTNSTA